MANSGQTAYAATSTFDFESTAATSTPAVETGALTSLALTNNGLSLTITRGGGAAFDIANGSANDFPASFGSRTLDPFFATSSAANFFLGNLSAPVTSASFLFGDYDSDDDLLTFNGYSGSNGIGTLVATFTVDYPIGNDFS